MPASSSEDPVSCRLPDFLMIGAAKSGTTMLTQRFRRHPRLCVSRVKESEFFARDEVFAKGFDWYHSLFEDPRPDQLCCDASTAYSRSPQYPLAAERIAKSVPDAKLIYVMRNPVDRAYSHYVHRITKELYPGEPVRVSFEEHVKADPMCIDGSRYMDQINKYLPYYPKERFLFLFSENLRADPESVLSQIWAFLGIEEVDTSNAPVIANDAKTAQGHAIRSQTTGPLRRVPGLHAAARALPQSWRDKLYSLIAKSPYGKWQHRRHSPPELSHETRSHLINEFREPNRCLAEFLGKDLSHWSELDS